ncbi:MAG: glycosyltransferase [Candidatus Delongbacteria bacterium]|jgi:glycosyltransferase involved in cell wall biosynthesis|nr:glycosyltransferase [Candidatus Delongbacteria bacterium]
MNILFLANKVPWPLKDGGAIGTFNLAYGLHLNGCDVSILSMNTSKHPVGAEDIPTDIREKLKIDAVNINTDIRFSSLIKNLIFSRKPYIAERFKSDKFREKLKHYLQTKKIDIVILEILYMGTYIPVIREYSDAHINFHAPNIEHEIWQRIANHEKNPFKKLYFKLLSRRISRMEFDLINTYDSLVPVSETNAATYRQKGVNVPVFVANIGVFFDKIDRYIENHNNANEALSLAHIGALDWIPNLEGLVWFLTRVWPDVHKKCPDIKFYIAGRNAPEKILEICNKPGVEYLGEVPDAYKFILSKSIMVVPLLSGSGMRVKIIESLALKRAIVSTSVGVEGINLINNKHIRIEDDPKAFAKACVELCDDKNKRISLGEAGNQMVREHYDNLKICKSLKTFYQDILK